ncbi:MAG: arginine repressor [Bdellovibrionota bacterium]
MTLEELVLKTIQTKAIEDQKTLLTQMAAQGYEIDQSTLSRIFKKLNIKKHLGRYVAQDLSLTAQYPSKNTLLVVPPNLILIKTRPGFASALSTTLDGLSVNGVAGTIAGDDTVFVAVFSHRPIEEIKLDIEDKLKL